MRTVKRQEIARAYRTGRHYLDVGVVNESDLPIINGVLRLVDVDRPGMRLLELGTCTGSLLVQLKRMAARLELWSVNVLPGEAVCRLRADELIPKERIGIHARRRGVAYHQIYGDTLHLDFRPWGLFDVAFIDACHAYPYVSSDTRKALGVLRPGGVILWHDYGNPALPDVALAVDQFDAGDGGGRVTRVDGSTLAFYQDPAPRTAQPYPHTGSDK